MFINIIKSYINYVTKKVKVLQIITGSLNVNLRLFWCVSFYSQKYDWPNKRSLHLNTQIILHKSMFPVLNFQVMYEHL